MVSLPGCCRVLLRGPQTVCSAACRRQRSRDWEAAALYLRDEQMRALRAMRLLESDLLAIPVC